MATGPKHYEIAAEILSALADDMQAGHINTTEDVAKAHLVTAQAQAHATLALAAATALNEIGLSPRDLDDWTAVASAKDGTE